MRDYAKAKAGKDDVRRAPCPEISGSRWREESVSGPYHIGDIKDMGVDHLIGFMEELFTYPIDVNWQQEKERTKARKCLGTVKQMRKAIEEPEATLMR